ncbi:hypothetical protein, partial [uncultured Brevundimonas sp.]|uniref:hypothetical protein n=1 Tax=uncultured Brevundimonas sp. TaxID=213418 RepID=UPI0026139114
LPPASMTRVNQPPPSEAIADFFNGIHPEQTFDTSAFQHDPVECQYEERGRIDEARKTNEGHLP